MILYQERDSILEIRRKFRVNLDSPLSRACRIRVFLLRNNEYKNKHAHVGRIMYVSIRIYLYVYAYILHAGLYSAGPQTAIGKQRYVNKRCECRIRGRFAHCSEIKSGAARMWRYRYNVSEQRHMSGC